MPADEVLLRLAGVRQSYSGRCVVDVPELHIEQGEFLAIMGPSGAGKTSLLRILNLLEAPHEGGLYLSGEQLPGRPTLEDRRRVTTVFQRPKLLSRSVEQNVSLGLQMRGVSDPARVAMLLDRVGLKDLAQASALELSGGEQQRVALARALAIQPEILLLDEATANLDPLNTAIIENLLQEEHATQKTTIIFVTHNQFQARRIAESCLLMLEGKVVARSATDHFFSAAADGRVRAFLAGELVIPPALSQTAGLPGKRKNQV